MAFDIQIGEYKLGMLDKVEIHKSQELLADTATITLPSAVSNLNEPDTVTSNVRSTLSPP